MGGPVKFAWMQKLYCYVDETGQDTKGELFIVSVIVTGSEREELTKYLLEIEKKTGKGNVKWHEADKTARLDYIRAVLKTPLAKGKITYACYPGMVHYFSLTILTTARAITTKIVGQYQATVFVDGLPHSQVKSFGTELRHLHIRTKKIRGVRKEETEPLVRLADAVCGFVREAAEGKAEMSGLLERGKAEGVIREL